jgi:phosphoenolpyruvate---glycerone phosphotransferase subunit DhaL
MTGTIEIEDIGIMIQHAAEKIRRHRDELSKLDAATGDGDHGTSIVRAMDMAEKVFQENQNSDIKLLLNDVGWGVMGIDGGATGPLLGSFLMGLADGIDNKSSIDNKAIASMFESGLAKVRKRTKAQVGDKTMIDALVPAVESITEAVNRGSSVQEALQIAAQAAYKGAVSTKAFKAKFGRAKNLGDRTIGCQDPGATSMSLIFHGFAEAMS